MKTLKYTFGILMSFLAIAATTSCSEEEADFTPAGPAAVEATEYYFTNGTETNIVISPADKTIVATVNRANTEGEVTLDLIVTNPNEELFTVPTSVTFADGAATADVVVEVSDSLVFFQEYQFAIQIPEKHTNPYIAENNNPTLHYVVMRNDYAPFATGVYTCNFFGEAWETTLDYSPSLDLYRFKDCWMPGYDVTLTLDRETMEFEMTASAFTSGYVHSSYGMVTAEVYEGGSYNYFDPETMTFGFAYKWTVSAGSFGAFYDYFQITELHD